MARSGESPPTDEVVYMQMVEGITKLIWYSTYSKYSNRCEESKSSPFVAYIYLSFCNLVHFEC